jgi:hypothetical protein
MTTITSTSSGVQAPFEHAGFDEAQLAAASFLARYSGRTLEYRCFDESLPFPVPPQRSLFSVRRLTGGGRNHTCVVWKVLADLGARTRQNRRRSRTSKQVSPAVARAC